MKIKKYAIKFRVRDKQEIHSGDEVISGTWWAYGWVHVKTTSKAKARVQALEFLRVNMPNVSPQILVVKIK